MSLKMSYFFDPDVIEIGCDEVGAGCLAGDVCAGAVIWDQEINTGLVKEIKDSKLLSKNKREVLSDYIKDNAIDYAIGIATVPTIDTINILNARISAIHAALDEVLQHQYIEFDHILVDGNMFNNFKDIPHTCVIKGDNKYVSIAAASILAKVYRDEYMNELAKKSITDYGWEKNKGYGTKQHISAIEKFGITGHHRKSFEPIKSMVYDLYTNNF